MGSLFTPREAFSVNNGFGTIQLRFPYFYVHTISTSMITSNGCCAVDREFVDNIMGILGGLGENLGLGELPKPHLGWEAPATHARGQNNGS